MKKQAPNTGPKTFSRRTVVKIAAASLALIVIAFRPWRIWTRKRSTALNEGDWLTIAAFADTLIPKTEIGPSASEAGVTEFLRQMVNNKWPSYKFSVTQANWTSFYASLAYRLDEKAFELTGLAFSKIAPDRQIKIIEALSGGASAQVGYRVSGLEQKNSYPDIELYSVARVHVLQGYFADPKYGGNKDYAAWKAVKHVCHFNYPTPPDSCPPHVM